MKKSFLTSLCALCTLFLIPSAVKATKTDPIPSGIATTSRVLPFTTASTNTPYQITGAVYTSFSQAIYTKEELGASANEITAVEYFIKSGSGSATTRTLQVWIKEIEKDSFVINPSDARFYLIYDTISKGSTAYLPGTKVFSGNVEIPTSGSYTITFDNAFSWSGNKNICVTVADLTKIDCSNHSIRHAIIPTDRPRFNYRHSESSSSSNWYWIYNNSLDFWGLRGQSELRGMLWTESASPIVGTQCANRKYVPQAAFTFGEPVVTPPSTPNDLSVSATTTTSASLSWSSVSGATSYDIEQSTDGVIWNTLATGETGTSYNWTELSVASTQYARIRAHNDAGYSDWSDALTVTTDAVHSHDGITFSKWTSNNSLPAEAGNYYLNEDVVLPNYYTVPGNMNLCLNGHSIYTYYFNIVVPSDKTLTIYDNVGGGRIWGYYVGDNGSYYGLVSIDGGTFVLNGGSVENLANDFNNALEVSYGIYNKGTLKLSGAPAIIGYHGDIYLAPSKFITIESGKPLTNTTPYSIYKATIGTITSGWANMSGANPSAFFTSKTASQGVCYNSGIGEAVIVRMFSTSDSNESIKSDLEDGTYQGQLLNFKITSRSFTSTQYNTICLPFALTNAQLEYVFGAGYDLEEFDHSNYDGETLELIFAKRTSLTEGVPYLIQPSMDVENPVFDGVTFYISEPGDDDFDDHVSFHGTFGPTSLTGGNQNILFLGADNTLFWPESTGNINGFRAYFELKGAAANAVQARIGRAESQTTAIDNQKSHIDNHKYMKDGQLLIERNGVIYNAQGQTIK